MASDDFDPSLSEEDILAALVDHYRPVTIPPKSRRAVVMKIVHSRIGGSSMAANKPTKPLAKSVEVARQMVTPARRIDKSIDGKRVFVAAATNILDPVLRENLTVVRATRGYILVGHELEALAMIDAHIHYLEHGEGSGDGEKTIQND